MISFNLKSEVVKAGLWYTFGNILIKGISFLTLPIFTRLLTTTDFGIYNTYIAYESIISIIISLGVYASINNAKIDFKDDFNKYISSVCNLFVMFFVLVIIVTNIVYPLFPHSKEFDVGLTNILILHSFGSAIINYISLKYVIEMKYRLSMIIALILTLCNVFISLYLCLNVYNSQRYLGRILGSAAGVIIIGIILYVILQKDGKCIINKKYWKYALAIGLPIIPHALSLTLLSQVSRIMIKDMVGYSEVGIFSLAYTMASILSLIMNSLDSAWRPWFYKNYSAQNYSTLKRKNDYYIFIFTIVTIVLCIMMPEIIKVISSKEYWESTDVTIPLIVAVYFNFMYLFAVNKEYFHKKTIFISVGTIICVVLNVVLNYILIKLFGYKAAAYAAVISNIALFLLHDRIAKKIDKNAIVNQKCLFIGFIVVFAIAAVTILFENNLLIRFGILCVIVFGLFINRGKFKELIIAS